MDRNKRHVDILLENEIIDLKAYTRGRYFRDYMMICLALGTGLRNSELINLRVENIRPLDEISSILDLPAAIAKGNTGRQIPLHPDLRTLLEEFLKWKWDHGENIDPAALLFLSKFTRHNLSPRDFQRLVRSLSLAAIGRPIHPHVLRHTFATRLLTVSNLRVVQKVLGHKNICTTTVYTHPSQDEVFTAISKM